MIFGFFSNIISIVLNFFLTMLPAVNTTVITSIDSIWLQFRGFFTTVGWIFPVSDFFSVLGWSFVVLGVYSFVRVLHWFAKIISIGLIK